MQTEIERKFLTTSSLFKEQAVRVMNIQQGYIGTTSKGEARVSIRDEKAWIIVKSNERLSRLEYEIPIPKKDAEELLKRTCGRIIHKTRYIIPATSGMLKWEVDEFHGEDEGLIIAEIELPSEDTQFEDNSDRIIEIHEFMGGDTIRVNYEDKDNPYLKIETLEGIMKASVGDYIIKGVNGEFYPCKPDIFEKTYERVIDEAD